MAKRGIHAAQNSFHWLCSEFMASSKFAGLALNSQKLWTRELTFACRVLGRALLKPETKKDEDQVIRPKIVQDYLGALVAETPAKAAVALSAFRALGKWAEVSDLLARDITRGVTVPRPEGGHTPWTDEQVELAIKHARPDLARVIVLGACTGQRRSDLVKMCWSDITTTQGRQGIEVTQKKTKRVLWIPINEPLARALAGWERRPGRILLNMWGQPWNEQRLTEAWAYELKKNPHLAPLRGLVLHGLRGYRCVQLFREGLNPKEIGNLVGMTTPMVERYTRLSEQRLDALASVIRLENFRGTSARKAENE